MTQNVIRLSRFSKTFGKTRAVRDVSFSVERGQTCGLLGLNGAGKTTMLSSVLGIQRPSSGSVALFGEDPMRLSPRSRARVGVVLEDVGFFDYLSGRDNLRLVARYKRVPAPAVDETLERLAIKDAGRTLFGRYSLGMKQRLAIGAALLGEQDLVILDEPTKGLDSEGVRLIRDLLVGMRDLGKTVLISSHLLTEVERISTHIAVIDKGRLQAYGTMDEILGGWRDTARLVSDDLHTLANAVIAYPGVTSTRVEGGAVVVEADDLHLSSLNSFLHERGIHLSFLEPVRASLEDVFREVLDGPSKTGEEMNGSFSSEEGPG